MAPRCTSTPVSAGPRPGALVLGKRLGWPKDKMRPHNLTLTMLGAGLLWFGWYGFNVGSIVFGRSQASEEADLAQFFMGDRPHLRQHHPGHLAAMLGWLLMERILHGKATSLGAASGIVAGLVAITPACGAVDLVGRGRRSALIAGVACAWAVGLKYKLGIRRLARRGRCPPRRRSSSAPC